MRTTLGLIAALGLLAADAGMRADDKPSAGDKPAAGGPRGEHDQQLTRMKELRDLHDKLDEVLRGKRQALTQPARQGGSSKERVVALKHELALKRLNAAEEELAKTELTRIKVEAELGVLQGKEKGLADEPTPESAVDESISKDSVVKSLRERIDRVQEVLREIERASIVGKKDSLYRMRSRELDAMNAQLAARREKLRPVAGQERQLKGQEVLRARTEELQERIAVLKAQEKALTHFLDRLRKEARTMTESPPDLEALKGELAETEEMSKKLARAIEALSAEPSGDHGGKAGHRRQSRDDGRSIKIEKKLDRLLKEVQKLRQEIRQK